MTVEKNGVRDTGFYSSKKWLKVRDFIKMRDNMICQSCGEFVTGKYIVDHKKQLTLENVTDWEIAYNPDNLQLLCLECHNSKTFSKKRRPDNVNFY
jgi:5-methylcytosine-specific restriction protein A